MCVKVRPPRPVSRLSLRQSSICPRLSSPGPEVAAAGGSAAAGPITARQPSSRPIGGLLAAAGRVIVSCERLSCRWQDFISKINTRTGGTTTQHRAQLSDARPQKPQLNLDLKTKNNPCLHLGSLLTVQMIHWTWHGECQIYLDAWFVLMLYSDSQTMAVGTHSKQWSRYSGLNKSRYVAVNPLVGLVVSIRGTVNWHECCVNVFLMAASTIVCHHLWATIYETSQSGIYTTPTLFLGSFSNRDHNALPQFTSCQ